MAKILQKYIKFSTKELQQYAANPESCVLCVNTDQHLSMGPYGMANFKNALHELLIRTKVGIYDANLNGIVLGIKNIKVLGNTAALRADDPTLHLVINADFYVLRPRAGAVLHGVVRHISKHQISAIIYRVFNTTIRFTNKKQASRDGIAMEQEIKFRIKDFNIANVMPYIEGELLLEETEQQVHHSKSICCLYLTFIFFSQNKSIKFEDDDEEEIQPKVEPEADAEEDAEETATETKPNTHVELDALVELIKMEPGIAAEESPKKKKSEKSKKSVVKADKVVPQLKKSKKIKTEPV